MDNRASMSKGMRFALTAAFLSSDGSRVEQRDAGYSCSACGGDIAHHGARAYCKKCGRVFRRVAYPGAATGTLKEQQR